MILHVIVSSFLLSTKILTFSLVFHCLSNMFMYLLIIFPYCFSPYAADEVLIIKSVTHKDFNDMIKVMITSHEA